MVRDILPHLILLSGRRMLFSDLDQTFHEVLHAAGDHARIKIKASLLRPIVKDITVIIAHIFRIFRIFVCIILRMFFGQGMAIQTGRTVLDILIIDPQPFFLDPLCVKIRIIYEEIIKGIRIALRRLMLLKEPFLIQSISVI